MRVASDSKQGLLETRRLQTSLRIAEPLCRAVAFLDRLSALWATAEACLTYSAGWAVHTDRALGGTTVGHADAALYRAKHGGRNHTVGHDEVRS
jgi:GGDEF domain-containing protein